LLAKLPRPLVHLHSRDATARSIQSGEEVWVITPRAKVKFTACVSEDIVPGAIEANMGGGGILGPQAWREANVNALTDFEHRDPISGFPIYKALLCDVVKVEEGADLQASAFRRGE
jgi:anaerobic selenocysteine-containing dehydrogenase